MGNAWSIPNVTEETFPNGVTYPLVAYYDDQGVEHAFEPNSQYYIQYQVTHDATGESITKTYPTPFLTKPLLGVTSFDIRAVYTDEFTLSVRLENVQYTHEMYRNSLLAGDVYAKVWDTEFENDGFFPVRKTFNQDFDTNTEVLLQSEYFQQGEFVSLEVTLHSLFKQTAYRFFIPFVPLPGSYTLYPTSGGL